MPAQTIAGQTSLKEKEMSLVSSGHTDLASSQPFAEVAASLSSLLASCDSLAQFSQKLLPYQQTRSSESALAHAQGVVDILIKLGFDDGAIDAAWLFLCMDKLHKEEKVIKPALFTRFVHPEEHDSTGFWQLAEGVNKLVGLESLTRSQSKDHSGRTTNVAAVNKVELRQQAESLRKMLLAFAQDIRVVIIFLASRLQSMRYFAANKLTPPLEVSREAMDLLAPLANRLGIGQLKWELEDLAFRFTEPEIYKKIARLLDEKRVEREQFIESVSQRIRAELTKEGIRGEVTGRPKNIYSIFKKMRDKHINFEALYDVRAFRIIVEDIKTCYTVLSLVHQIWSPITEEFDDYIARPKANGYKSLHTVVIDENGKNFEVQVRTYDMHQFAEYGVAAHWRYKELGAKGFAGMKGFATDSEQKKYDEKIALFRQLLAWKTDVEKGEAASPNHADNSSNEADSNGEKNYRMAGLDEQIYILTPQARVIELPATSTPIDFAYHLHTDLGHRCRGARVNGAMVPLNTPLQNGQTVEIISARRGTPATGPSRDWLNPNLGYIQSNRARQKVRQWFNALELAETIALGRSHIERILQREGKTSTNLEDLSRKLGFDSTDDLFIAAGKEDIGAKRIESALHGDATALDIDIDKVPLRKSRHEQPGYKQSGVLVVGVGSLLTQLAKCCKPAPPDAIIGFVTRGKGVSIHRETCSNFAQMQARSPERVVQTTWGENSVSPADTPIYPVDIVVQAQDRQGLLRDISEVFAREKMNVIGVNTQTVRHVASMQFTVEVNNSTQLQRAINLIAEVSAVISARRK